MATPAAASAGASSSTSAAAPAGIDLTRLTPQQLVALHRELEAELAMATSSHANLRQATSQFAACRDSLARMQVVAKTSEPGSADGKTEHRHFGLIPLTTMLYVKAMFPGLDEPPSTAKSNQDSDVSAKARVIVDVGTGYFVEKSVPEAVDYYKDKVAALETTLAEIEKSAAGKQRALRVVSDFVQSTNMRMAGAAGGGAPTAVAAEE